MIFNFTLDNKGSDRSDQEALAFISTRIIGTLVNTFNLSVGILLHVAIIRFERYGGDPQKRSVGNQLVAAMSATFIVFKLITGFTEQLLFLFGPIGPALSTLAWGARFSLGLFVLMCLSQIMLHRSFLLFKWTTATGMDDNFVARFLILVNSMIALFVTMLEIYVGNHFATPSWAQRAGCDAWPKRIIPSQNWLLVPGLFIVGSLIAFLGIQVKKAAVFIQDRRSMNQVLPFHGIHQDQENSFNTHRFNENLVSLGQILSYNLLFVIHYIILRQVNSNFYGFVVKSIILLGTHNAFFCLFVCYKSDLRTFTTEMFRDIAFRIFRHL